MSDQVPKQVLREQWRNIAPQWIEKTGDAGDASRVMLDPHVHQSCLAVCGGDFAGQRVLDLGCGEGRFARQLSERGASVQGIDPCEPLIAEAQRRAGEGQSFAVASAEDLPAEDDGFDLVVSYLSLCDMPDARAAMREAFRVLRPGGGAVVCTIHPMAVSPGGSVGWVKDYNGQKLFRTIDRYFDEGPFTFKMAGQYMTNFHRTLQGYLDAFFDVGFGLRRLVEPKPSPDALDTQPDLADELRVPSFIVFELTKPEAVS